ncbi:hypothetical protein GCM10017673_03930 [Streptosporangium violaceochromogenes]|nr:hypothetical protein GCM10017673_03930 [Streptosporangium violaceochromogenes]
MIEFRNVLAAGAMVASALLIPATTSAQPAAADTTPRSTVSSPHGFLAKPCWKYDNPRKRAACYRWRGYGY